MKKRRLISLLTALSLSAALFAGCGEKQEEVKTSNDATKVESSSTTSTEQKAPADEPKEITEISVFMRGLSDVGAANSIVAAMNEYSSEKIGVTIKFTNLDAGEYLDKLKLGFAAKEDIDLCFMSTGTGITDFIEQDALMDLTALLPEYEELYTLIPEGVWQTASFDDKIYVVPNYKETFVGTCVVTPKALADTVKEKYGIDFNAIECKDTFDFGVYEEYILACIEEGVEVPLPYKMTAGFNVIDSEYVFINTDYVMNKKTNEVSLLIETEKYAEYHKKMMDWVDKGIWKEEQVMSDFSYDEILKSGNYALRGWTTVPDNEAQAASRYGHDVYVKEVTDKIIRDDAVLGSTWAIPAYCEEADACLSWLQLLNTDPVFADMFVYGIEGEQYTKDANGIITKIDSSGWNNAVWRCTNYLVPSILSTESVDKKEQYDAANADATTYELTGFQEDLTAFENEYAAVKAVRKEYKDLLDYGFSDEKQLEAAITSMKAAGSDKIKEELQKQVDAFMAGK